MMDESAEPSLALRTIIAGVYFTLAMGGIAGNILVLTTFLKERRRSYFHVQLAVVNSIYLCCIALSGPSALRGRWLFSDTWCQAYAAHAFTGGNLNFGFISTICIESCFAVCHKGLHRQLSGVTFAVVSVLIWAYSLGFGLAPFFGWSSFSIESNGGTSCGLDLNIMDKRHYSYLVLAVLGLVAQLAAAGAALVPAFRECRDNQKQLSPLLNDKELVKISVALLTTAVLGSGLYSYRILEAMAVRQSQLSFLGVELSHVFVKAIPALSPLFYYIFGSEFLRIANSVPSGKSLHKKRT